MKEAAPIVEQTSGPAKQNEVETTKQHFKDSNSNTTISGELIGAGDTIDHSYDFGRLPIHAEENMDEELAVHAKPFPNSLPAPIASPTPKVKQVKTAANSPQRIVQNLGKGQALAGSVKSRMEGAYGKDFSRVEIHTDSRASTMSRNMNARAFAVGNHIAFSSGEYKPGTLIGDALIAHELAHVVQQENAVLSKAESTATVEYNSLERDADFSAVNVVSKLWGSTFGYLKQVSKRTMPAIRSGLQLQSCGFLFGEDDEEIERTVMQILEAEGEWDSLIQEVRKLDAMDLEEAERQTNATSEIGKAVRFDRAYRAQDWSTMAEILRSSNELYQTEYRDDFVTLLMANGTSIKVKGDTDFKSYIDSAFYELSGLPSGFRLIIELLATGKSVTIEFTNDVDQTQATNKADTGRINTYSDDLQVLQVEDQTPGISVGSEIKMNPELSGNRVVLTKSNDQFSIIDMEDSITLGHELIHALHNAQGTALRLSGFSGIASMANKDFGMVRDPDTGERNKPEELTTVSGQTKFDPPEGASDKIGWPVEFNVESSDQITENMLRRDAQLDLRAGYTGARQHDTKQITTGTSLDQMLGRYYLEGGGEIPDNVKVEIRLLFLELNSFLTDDLKVPKLGSNSSLPIRFPHPSYIQLHMRYVISGTSDEAMEELLKLKIR